MDVFVARQPIFDTRLRLFAYELLFRSSAENRYVGIDGNQATAQVIATSFLHIGREELVGNRRSFINFTADLLLDRAPLALPRESIVVEVLESVPPTPEILEACRELRDQGYWLALDDFVLQPEYAPLVELARIIKIDLQQTPLATLGSTLAVLRNRRRTVLLAEKVETAEEVAEAARLGFQLFQGYFFARPQVVQGRRVDAGRSLTVVRILAELNDPEFSVERVEQLIRANVSLSYQMLRYVNSASHQRTRRIDSVKEALVMLGTRTVKHVLSILLLQGLSSGKPSELTRVSVLRASFAEQLDGERGPELFTLGLFSLLDALLDQPMATVLAGLPLSHELREALIEGRGPLAPYLALVRAYEQGQWPQVSLLAAQIGRDETDLPARYAEAVRWSESMTQ